MEKRKGKPRPASGAQKENGKSAADPAPELGSGSTEEVEASYTLKSPVHTHQ